MPKPLRKIGTHESVFVTYVVGELQFVEGHHLLHPLLARRRGVGVDVHPLRHFRVCFTSDHPSTPETKGLVNDTHKDAVPILIPAKFAVKTKQICTREWILLDS